MVATGKETMVLYLQWSFVDILGWYKWTYTVDMVVVKLMVFFLLKICMMCGSNGVTINQANTAILYVATNKKSCGGGIHCL